MNVVVLVVDRLHAGYLGCYGNTWIATPETDRLSVESFVFDQALAAGPRLSDAYAGYWHVRHPLSPVEASSNCLPEMLRDAGYQTTLLTDDEAVLQLEGAEQFAQTSRIECVDNPRAAAEMEETHLARFFAAAVDALESAEGPFLLWLHTRGLGGPWDAPREFRAQYAEAGEAEPPQFTEVPNLSLAADYDPDQLWATVQAYAGQVTLCDACLGVFARRLGNGPWDQDTLLVVTAPRGFPLGEHRHVGADHEALHGELLHTPSLWRFPTNTPDVAAGFRTGQADRSAVLTQPTEVGATLLDACRLPLRDGSVGQTMLPIIGGDHPVVDQSRRYCVFDTGSEQAIRTAAWFMRESSAVSDESPDDSTGRTELFVKPDDRWEFNDVADRCRSVVAGLRDSLSAHRQALAAGESTSLRPLAEELVTRPE